MALKREHKVIDSIRYPKVQGRYEDLMKSKYKSMLNSMVKMLSVGLERHIAGK